MSFVFLFYLPIIFLCQWKEPKWITHTKAKSFGGYNNFDRSSNELFWERKKPLVTLLQS